MDTQPNEQTNTNLLQVPKVYFFKEILEKILWYLDTRDLCNFIQALSHFKSMSNYFI